MKYEIRRDLQHLLAVSRPEFIPANMGSFIIGLAWGYDVPRGFSTNLLTIATLSFLIITVVSFIGAQLNTLSDFEQDSKDPRKSGLINNLLALGQKKVKTSILIELLVSFALVLLLVYMRREPIQLAIYILALILTQAYSSPPLRLKGRSILAMISLSLALSVLPALFIYYSFTNELSTLFLIFLIGQTLTVYSIIIPTETRDYFIDKAMGVKTMSVWLGLSKATLLAFSLLAVGATLSISAFLMTTTFTRNPLLMLTTLLMIGADFYIFKSYRKLYTLSRRHEIYEADVKGAIGEEVVVFSSENPKWITLTTQAIILVNVVYLVGKIFL